MKRTNASERTSSIEVSGPPPPMLYGFWHNLLNICKVVSPGNYKIGEGAAKLGMVGIDGVAHAPDIE